MTLPTLKSVSLASFPTEFVPFIRGFFAADSEVWAPPPGQQQGLLALLIEHGMAPLLADRLGEQAGCLEGQLVDGLREAARSEVAFDLDSTREMQALLDRLSEQGISTVLLKGGALSQRLYDRAGLRPHSDFDLWVAEPAFARAGRTIKEAGFVPLSTTLADDNVEFSKQGRFGTVVMVDLHRRITNAKHSLSTALTFDRVYRTGLPLPAFGGLVRAPGNVESLLHAVFHRAQHFSHNGDRLIWLYDVHLLLQSMSDSELRQVVAQATALHMSDMLADAALTARCWFGTHLDQQFEAELRAAEPGDAGLYLESDPELGILNRLQLHLRETPGVRARAAYLWHRLFPPPAHMLETYGCRRRQLPLLYMLRLGRAIRIMLASLARKHGRSA